MPRLLSIAICILCFIAQSAAQQWQLPAGLAEEMAMDDALRKEDHAAAFRILTGFVPDSSQEQFPTYSELVSELNRGEVAILSLWGRDKVFVTLALKGKEFSVKSLAATQLGDIVEEYRSLQNKPSVSHKRLQVVSEDLFDLLGLDLSSLRKLIVVGKNPFTNLSWTSMPDKQGVWLGKNIPVRISPGLSQAFLERRNPQPGHLVYGVAPRSGLHDAIHSIHAEFGGRMDRDLAASWANYKQFAPLANFVHLEQACMTDGTSPALDKVIFSDTLLPLQDLPKVALTARMAIVKGSCSGHTVQSLSHAFAQAGCPSMIGSLWEVQGLTNEHILAQCYRNIKRGYSFDKALQKAQLAYLDTAPEDRQQPYYWAGLVLSGAAGKAEGSNIGWVLLLILLISTPLIWAFRKKKA